MLTAEFPSLDEQERDDPENAFPNDYVSLVVAYVGKHWGGLPEDLPEFCEWEATTVRVTADTLNPFDGLFQMLMMKTIPVRLVLE